jgi:hypothetical protein
LKHRDSRLLPYAFLPLLEARIMEQRLRSSFPLAVMSE